MEPRIVESVHRSDTGSFGLVVDKCAIALSNQENALDVSRRVSGEVVLQIRNLRLRRQVSNPQGMPRLFGLSWRSSREVWNRPRLCCRASARELSCKVSQRKYASKDKPGYYIDPQPCQAAS